MNSKIKAGSLVLVKPNNDAYFKRYNCQIMGVEKIEGGMAKTSWIKGEDGCYNAYRTEIPLNLLWEIKEWRY
ncbi:MAG TPA: hypothetical protein VNX01_05570 [Bacteroidia bacterium]|jgi:hypothetical protein|nr:hypothetical protein [Bacteroidia bacterium]